MIEIILEISMRFQLFTDDLLSKSRTMPLPEARHRIFGECYSRGFKQVEIASAFNVSQQAVSSGITHYYQTKR